MKKVTAIVAGGAGFIGSHLCRRLLDFGRRVIAIDNLSTGSINNLNQIQGNPNFELVISDIVNPINITMPVQEIYNMACPASPLKYQSNPIETFMTSTVGSYNLLEFARHHNSRILLASTSEVYGDSLKSPQSEDYFGNVNPIGIRSCYDEGKRGAESLFTDYNRCFGVDTRIVRIFNTYGPQMMSDDGRVIPSFINQALHGKTLTINGDGSQTRAFMFIDDLIDALMLMMRDGVTHMPVNLGNPTEITINSLASLIIDATGSNSWTSYRPMPSDDPRKRCPDISRARSELCGWSPKVSLSEGLENTINYFRKLHYDTVH